MHLVPGCFLFENQLFVQLFGLFLFPKKLKSTEKPSSMFESELISQGMTK